MPDPKNRSTPLENPALNDGLRRWARRDQQQIRADFAAHVANLRRKPDPDPRGERLRALLRGEARP